VNGSKSGEGGNASAPVYEAEMFDPFTNPPTGNWTTLAPMTQFRLYHSTALLLPDGRVLSAGSDREWKDWYKGYDVAQKQVEVFSPPYLFWGPRPKILWNPKQLSYGKTFKVATDEADSIKSVVLIRNGSCTHAFNSDQRLVELDIKARAGFTLPGKKVYAHTIIVKKQKSESPRVLRRLCYVSTAISSWTS